MFSDVITLPLNRGDITVMSYRDCKSPIDEREGEKERRRDGGEREKEVRGENKRLLITRRCSRSKTGLEFLTRPLVSFHGDKLVPAPGF